MPTLLGLCHPDVVLDNSNATFDPAVYQGHQGLIEFFSLGRDMWESQRFELQEAVPVGTIGGLVPQRIVSDVPDEGRRRRSRRARGVGDVAGEP